MILRTAIAAVLLTLLPVAALRAQDAGADSVESDVLGILDGTSDGGAAGAAAPAAEETKKDAESKEKAEKKKETPVAKPAATEKKAEAPATNPPGSGDDDAAAATGGATAPAGPAPLFHFRDLSKVAGSPDITALDVRTDYGVLRVPVAEIIRVRFARRLARELREEIDRLVAQLGSDDFDEREDASARLEEIGAPAMTALRRAAKSPDDEVKSRAQEILDAVFETAEKEKEERGEEGGEIPPLSGTEDEIVTTRMTIKGHVEQEVFVIRSKYGLLTVDTAKLAGVIFRVIGPSSLKVSVAATYQPPGNWLDTKLEIEKGQRLRLAASGQTNVSNYGVTSGPAGSTQYSTSRSFNRFPVLSLVGKIGKKGKPFLVGTEYKGKATRSGRLYLGVTPFYYNPGGATGSYSVKGSVGGQ